MNAVRTPEGWREAVTQVKLLVIVTNDALRSKLLQTWRESTVQKMGMLSDEPVDADDAGEPVAFSRIDIREGLSLCMFVVDGGWRREYVCQALARRAAGYCLVIGPGEDELSLAGDLLLLLHSGGAPRGVVAIAQETDADRVRASLGLPEDARVPTVDCGDAKSFVALLSNLLDRLAAAAAA